MVQFTSQVAAQSKILVFIVLVAITLGALFIFTNKSELITLTSTTKLLKAGETTHSTFQGRRKNLPSLKDGGILFFLHIPKSGGTTIRESLKYKRGGRRSRIHYIYLTGPREYDYTVQQMNDFLVNGTGYVNDKDGNPLAKRVVVIEFHALDRNCPSFLQLSQSDLRQWKAMAYERKIPFFAFSLIREPVSFAVSFFNFYHAMEQNPNRFDFIKRDLITEELFLQNTIANPQCLFLGYNEDAYTKTGQDLRDSLREEHCIQSYKAMQELLDWVGTTETIATETLPLLQELLHSNNSTNRLIRNFHRIANPSSSETSAIRKNLLSKMAIDFIRNKTKWDLEIYESARRDFIFDDWFVGLH